MRARVAAYVWAVAGFLQAQAPAPAQLENRGKPIHVPFQCSEEDIRAYGLTCPPEHPCPVYLELAGAEAVGNRLFLTGNLHSETATFSSILLMSADRGKTWSEPYERIHAAGLDQIQFFDFERGWIGGQLLGAVPSDPFLLLTRDGGKSWYRRPVFGESRQGALDYFHFDSKEHGMLWLDRSLSGEPEDRYERYESMTGGESWMVRETSGDPLRKGPRPESSEALRLRTDPQTHSYRLEQSSGSGWDALASFEVQAGTCREGEPQPEKLPEEPPPVAQQR